MIIGSILMYNAFYKSVFNTFKIRIASQSLCAVISLNNSF